MNIDLLATRVQKNCIHLFILLLLSFSAFGQNTQNQPDPAQAGHIIIGSGHLIAKTADGNERRLRRRSPVYAGDTIIVGKNAFIQIRFSDGALFSLRPGSEFKISQYRHQEQADENGKAVFELLKGGLRTISGTIGKKKRKNYQLNTPISTIGIRGTHYGTRLCAGDCRTPQGELMPDGQYGGVVDGAISVTPRAGSPSHEGGQRQERIFDNDHYFYLARRDAPIKNLLGPPGIVFDPAVTAPQEHQQERRKETPGSAGKTRPKNDQHPVTPGGQQKNRPTRQGGKPKGPNNNLNVFGKGRPGSGIISKPVFKPSDTRSEKNLGLTPAPLGAAALIAAIPASAAYQPIAEAVRHKGPGSSDEIYLDTVGNIGNVVSRVIHRGIDCAPECAIGRGTAVLVDDGGLAAPGINWGRWRDGWHGFDGNNPIQGAGSWHYIYSPNVTSQTDLEGLNITAIFLQMLDSTSTIPLGTRPTDQFGNTGTWGTGTNRAIMAVDFGAAKIIDYKVQMNFSGNILNGHLQGGPVDFIQPGASFMLDSCAGSGCTPNPTTGTGRAAVTFVGPNASHAINSVELSAGSTKAVGAFVSKR